MLFFSFRKVIFTPWNIVVSSKHELAIFDDDHSMTFIVAPVTKGFCSPAVCGGAVVQQSLWIISYRVGDKKCHRLPRNLVLPANIVELISMPKQKSIQYLLLASGTSN